MDDGESGDEGGEREEWRRKSDRGMGEGGPRLRGKRTPREKRENGRREKMNRKKKRKERK